MKNCSLSSPTKTWFGAGDMDLLFTRLNIGLWPSTPTALHLQPPLLCIRPSIFKASIDYGSVILNHSFKKPELPVTAMESNNENAVCPPQSSLHTLLSNTSTTVCVMLTALSSLLATHEAVWIEASRDLQYFVSIESFRSRRVVRIICQCARNDGTASRGFHEAQDQQPCV